ncbi:MAG: hypothetical protein LBV16_02460 [Elusimicrobiota bacterium]|jgi:hypothetical protein|nr:hypothetical protein [Elusimicrobiota bacterium]
MIEAFIETMQEDEKEARLHGKFKHLVGLVYKEFSEIHRVDSFEIPENWTKVCACDFHQRKACYFVWVAIDENDIAYVYDELNTQGTIRQICEKVIAKEKEHKGRVKYRFIDSISSTPDRITGKCPQREIAITGNEMGHPLNFRASTKNWAMGKDAVMEYLQVKNGKPGIYFFKDRCRMLIESMTRYTWANANTKEGEAEKPRKMYDDAPDALRYALVLRIKYQHQQRINYEADNVYDYEKSITGYRLGG